MILLLLVIASGVRSYFIDMSDWPKLYKSTFLAGSTPVEWALKEDIDTLLDKLRYLMRYYEVERQVDPDEWTTANYWLNIDYNRTIDCLPYFERELVFHRQRLMENPSRIKLYNGRPPMELKLDSFIDFVRRTKYENCNRVLGSQLLEWIGHTLRTDLQVATELQSTKCLFTGTSDHSLELPLLDRVSAIILPRYSLAMFRKHNSERSKKKFGEIYEERIVKPCNRVANIVPSKKRLRGEYYISYIERYWLDQQPERVRSWLKLRNFCKSQSFVDKLDVNYVHFLLVVQSETRQKSLKFDTTGSLL